eukprot:CAMPEP_0117655634 /NCGR_PEP_ID=MMETSP0804-20121206/4384_1 /TAXON_ID=1074897 /ORGANISM="Tetraselmis astigmatica, Strain CCMP880" /LENGTH=241 /DNA_ID=CAMNT_0005461999 /DNA_START=174 /DNA_END=896 /DNA_ORIENTATION=+
MCLQDLLDQSLAHITCGDWHRRFPIVGSHGWAQRRVAAQAKKKGEKGRCAAGGLPSQMNSSTGNMADYMYFGQLLGQSAEEVKESVEETLGLEVDKESEEYLQDLGELEAMMDAALGQPAGSKSKAMKTLQRNKQQGPKTHMQLYQAQKKEQKKRQKEMTKASNAKLMKHKAHRSFSGQASSLAGLGDFGSILFSDEEGDIGGPKGPAATPPQRTQQSLPPLKAPAGSGRSLQGPPKPSPA